MMFQPSPVVQLSTAYLLAVVTRYLLYTSDYGTAIASRIEVSSPVNSQKRATEGWFRTKRTAVPDPYSSGLFHESPVHLFLYACLQKLCGRYLPLTYILFDVLAAHLLHTFARLYGFRRFIEETKNGRELREPACGKNEKDFVKFPLYVAVFYLFNPYTIFNCVALGTTTISNLILSLLFVGLIRANFPLVLLSLAFETLHAFYPFVLIAPACLALAKNKYLNAVSKRIVPVMKRSEFFRDSTILEAVLNAITFLFAFVTTTSSLLLICYYLHGSWSFLSPTYGFILSVPDQQPNVGVFWYFFTEIFEHFSDLFLWAYQLNACVVYVIPLTLRLRRDVPLLAAVLVHLGAIFKSYPSIGEFALPLALWPCWKRLHERSRQTFVSFAALVLVTALGPVWWDLWIYQGAANANFFFGATMGFAVANIFLLTDLAFAYAKCEYAQAHPGFDTRRDKKLILVA